MSTKKSRRKGGVFSRIANVLLGERSPSLEEGLTRHGNTITNFPDSYNDTLLDGVKVVDGKFCKTVGEYKAECIKKYGK